jgi:hypothetical protein
MVYNQVWSSLGTKDPVNVINSFETGQGILVDVRSIILSDDKASLDPTHADQPYTEAEAREAFNRMVARYGWNK